MIRLARSETGFTYIAALVLVVVMGIMLGAIGQSVKVIMKREREKELIFRGLQYRDAIERWNDPKLKRGQLKNLKDLVELTVSSNVSASKDRLLRKLYTDPITGGEWKTLPNPPDPVQGIYGVASTSSEEPFKQGNFPEVIKNFEGKKKYSDWEFIYRNTPSGQKPPSGKSSAGSTPPGQQIQRSFPLSTPESP